MSSDPHFMETCNEKLGNPPKKVKRDQGENIRTPDGGFKIKTYYPTWDEMKDFSAFMKKIHADNGNRAGLAKIIPPNGYKPRKAGYDDESLYEMEISHPIRQEVSGEGGLYQQVNVMCKKKLSVRNFKRLSEEKHPTPHHDQEGDLDRIFWKNIFTNPSMYGADVPGTLFDPDFEYFNLTKLNTILDNIQDDYGVTIEGVNTTYLYFGMWKSSFCWHTEDVDLYSINYLHAGAPKSWYCIAPEYGKRFERLATSFFPLSFKSCRAFLRHKTTLISPAILKKYSIPFSRCTQQPGEFMVTFPYSYHSGYNHGFNIAEATNFAIEYWIDYGKWATKCECSTESVKISMQTFVKRYQTDRYEDWIKGRDICNDPRDPKHKGPAPRPSDHDLYLIGAHDRTEADIYEEEEQTRKEIALQQNLSCNLKKAKSTKKSNKLKSDYERYTEYLKAHDSMNQQESKKKTPLPHFCPVPSQMIELNGQYPELTTTIPAADPRAKPDYDHLIKKSAKKLKSSIKRDERLSEKKEKRAIERIIMSQELLHYLPTTFTQEKKFNRCIAAQPPHCSICQLLVPHPKDDDAIWGAKATPDLKQIQVITSPNLIPQAQSTSNSQAGDYLMIVPQLPILGPQVSEFKIPETSNILLPRISFANIEKKIDDTGSRTGGVADAYQQTELREADSGYGDFLEFDLEKPSELLQCTVCMLAVHKLCYGVDKLVSSKTDWICDRCIESSRATISCALCPCRGGALKKINEVWVHMTCALTLNNVSHAQLTTKKEFKLPDVPERNTCVYCAKNMNLNRYVQGYTVGCIGYTDDDRNIHSCPNTFHPTCGHRNGALFDCLDFHTDPDLNYLIKAICSDCGIKSRLVPASNHTTIKEEPELDPIIPGTKVIVETSTGYFVDAIAEGPKTHMVYDIYYPELSTVELNISERMLVIPDQSKELRLGDEVQVKTTKGLKNGKIKAKRFDEKNFMIKPLKSEKSSRVRRENIYLNIDQMSEEQIAIYLENSKPTTSENVSSQ